MNEFKSSRRASRILRERHRQAEAETKEAETRMRNHRVEVAALEGDLHTIRRQIDEDRVELMIWKTSELITIGTERIDG